MLGAYLWGRALVFLYLFGTKVDEELQDCGGLLPKETPPQQPGALYGSGTLSAGGP